MFLPCSFQSCCLSSIIIFLLGPAFWSPLGLIFSLVLQNTHVKVSRKIPRDGVNAVVLKTLQMLEHFLLLSFFGKLLLKILSSAVVKGVESCLFCKPDHCLYAVCYIFCIVYFVVNVDWIQWRGWWNMRMLPTFARLVSTCMADLLYGLWTWFKFGAYFSCSPGYMYISIVLIRYRTGFVSYTLRANHRPNSWLPVISFSRYPNFDFPARVFPLSVITLMAKMISAKYMDAMQPFWLLIASK